MWVRGRSRAPRRRQAASESDLSTVISTMISAEVNTDERLSLLRGVWRGLGHLPTQPALGAGADGRGAEQEWGEEARAMPTRQSLAVCAAAHQDIVRQRSRNHIRISVLTMCIRKCSVLPFDKNPSQE